MDEDLEEINYKFDTQLLLEGKDLSDEKVKDLSLIHISEPTRH